MKARTKDSEKDEAFDAVRQAASGALGAVSELKPNSKPPGLSYAVPVVVTTHPLLIASLDEDGEPQVVRATSGCLLVRPSGADDSILVHVVAEEALDDLVEICRLTAEAFENVPLAESYGLGQWSARIRKIGARLARLFVKSK